jgi:hypothetical protein
VIDSLTQEPTPVRLRLLHENRPVSVPSGASIAIMFGFWDNANGYAALLDGSFYINGNFQMEIPPGTYHLSIAKGNEYLEQHHVIQVKPGQSFRQVYSMSRWINSPERGWYSGDDHIHIRRSPREDSLLLKWIQAEDIHVGVMLQMGDFWQTYYAQHAWGEKGVYQKNDYFITAGQEDPRTPELGHAIGMGAPEMVRYPKEYYLYDKVFDRLHEIGGIVGYAHQAVTYNGDRGLALDGLRNKVDVLEILQFCASAEPLIVTHYYSILDLGIPLTAVAGSDFPYCGTDHDSGPAQVGSSKIGNARFYTYLDKKLSYTTWKESLAAGHTFVSTGPVLEFTVNTSIPGDKLNVSKGTKLEIKAQAFGHFSQVPLRKLEIIAHGKVIAMVTKDDQNQSSNLLSINLDIPAEKGFWIAARAYGKEQQAAHTTPVYVTIDGGGFHNPLTAQHYLNSSKKALDDLETEIKEMSTEVDHQAWKYQQELQKRIDETREIIRKLRETLI